MAAVEAHDAVTIARRQRVRPWAGAASWPWPANAYRAENAVFGLPEPTLGIIPGAGGPIELPRIVGLGRAKEMILTGAGGMRGARWRRSRLRGGAAGAADEGRGRWPDACWSWARWPCACQRALNASSEMPQRAGLLYESALQAITFESEDKAEGTTAFLEKRKPRFKGE